MLEKLLEWFETSGRRLAELKIMGGTEFFTKGDKDLEKLESLSGEEWIEFFTLIGQYDGLMWALAPSDPDKAKQFHQQMTKKMEDIEKACLRILKITGRIKILKGKA